MTMTDRPYRLSLPDEVLLLALRADQGTAACGSMYLYAFGGALLAELVLQERLRIDGGRRDPVAVVDPGPIGEPPLDGALSRIVLASRPATAKTWIGRLARAKNLKQAALEGLCERGVLRAEQRKILGIFPRTVFPQADGGPERELRARVERAITEGEAAVDDRTAMLIAIAAAANLLRGTFGRRLIKARKSRIESIAHGWPVGDATRATVEAVQAATIAASAAAAVVVSS